MFDYLRYRHPRDGPMQMCFQVAVPLALRKLDDVMALAPDNIGLVLVYSTSLMRETSSS